MAWLLCELRGIRLIAVLPLRLSVSRRDESSITPCDLQASSRARVWRTVSRRDESSITPCDLQASPRASLKVWRPVRSVWSVWWPGVGRPYTWCLTLYCWLITSETTTRPEGRLLQSKRVITERKARIMVHRPESKYHTVWIGLRRATTSGSWTWTDGFSHNFNYWYPPDEPYGDENNVLC